MLGTRKRSLSVPARRRCCACQQRHTKCEYEKDDDKCKACRAGNRKCVVKHRFQHVDPGSKRQKKTRANSNQSKNSARSAEEAVPTQGNVFTAIEWTSEETNPMPVFDQGDAADNEQDNDEDNDEEVLEPVLEQTETDVTLTKPVPPSQPDGNFAIKAPSRSAPSGDTALEDVSSQAVTRSDSSLSFPTPHLAQFIQSPHLSNPIFSPNSFSALALHQTSPSLSTAVSIPTPENNRLAEREKAFLLRHFTDVLWKWFDICDPEQHFRRVVPVRALKCSTLMKAICASSAWHLCRKGLYDRDRSDFLYENCLRHLIKAMDSPNVGSDDSILIAAVIMHNVEELRDLEHTLMLESRGHLVGINIFLDASDSYWEENSLRQAALRVAVREELHTCFINQQPLMLPPNLCGIDRNFTPTNDETWAWRVLLIYRDALAHSLSPGSAGEWDRISNDLQTWYSLKPDSFEPTFFQESSPTEGRFLSEIWYLHDSHIIGIIHYHLCRIVLATSNPRVPKIGWNRAAALRKVDGEVRSNLIEVASIAMSNNLLPSAMTAGTMVITMCAEVVTDPSLQTALFEVFLKAKEIHGWPIEASQAYVRSVWYGEGEIEKTIGFGLTK